MSFYDPHTPHGCKHINLMVMMGILLQCFDDVVWVTGRTSSL